MNDIEKLWNGEPVYSFDNTTINILANYHLLCSFISDEKAEEINQFQKTIKNASSKKLVPLPEDTVGWTDFIAFLANEIQKRKASLKRLLLTT